MTTTSEQLDAISSSASTDVLSYHEEIVGRLRDELGAKQYYMLLSHIIRRKAQLACVRALSELLGDARTPEDRVYAQDIAVQLFEAGHITASDIQILSIKLREHV